MNTALIMSRAWKIAERAAFSMGGSKQEYFRGLWKDYKAIKKEVEKLSLDEYFEEYEKVPYPQELPTMVYHEGQGGDDYTPEYLPTGTNSGAWYVINNTFDDSPDGKNRLWLGRGEWQDGDDYTTNQVMISFSHIANNREPYKSYLKGRRIKWDNLTGQFLWETYDRPADNLGHSVLDMEKLKKKAVDRLTSEYKKGTIGIEDLIKEFNKL